MFTTQFLISTFILFISIPYVSSDLCVMCYRFDVEGNWVFRYDETNYEPNLFDQNQHCGHRVPNVQGKNWDVKLEKAKNIQVSFEYPNKFFIIHPDGTKEEGWWTMVYNVAFMAQTKTMSFYGNFDYKVLRDSECGKQCDSYCDRTLASWYKDLTTGRLGCFYGHKVELFENDDEETKLFSSRTSYDTPLDDIPGLQPVIVEQLQENNLKYEDLEFLVSLVNNQTDGKWQAAMNTDFLGKTFSSLKKLMGRPACKKEKNSVKSVIDFLEQPQIERNPNATKSEKYKEDFINAIKNDGLEVDTNDPILKYWYTHPDDFPDSELPEQWDWRNVNGENFINEARNQANCGSCYVLGTLSGVENRIRIATKNKLIVFFMI